VRAGWHTSISVAQIFLAAGFTRSGTLQVRLRSSSKWSSSMVTTKGAFIAGIITTFALAGGFGGGLMIAQSAGDSPSGYQARIAEPLPPARVILPNSAEAARQPQQ
jgi:hypothetical protein